MKVLTAENCAILGVAASMYGLAVAARRRRDHYESAGKVALINGGSRGFGLALAREFAGQGALLILRARDAVELQRAPADPPKRSISVDAYSCDVSDPAQVNEMMEAVRQRYGRSDVLVIMPALAVLPHMRQGGEGRIVTITSVGGKVSVPHLLPYSCAKFATVAFFGGTAV